MQYLVELEKLKVLCFANYINADFGYGISFIILILVLILRPQGLVGKETIEKV